jgi:hypothetical protein
MPGDRRSLIVRIGIVCSHADAAVRNKENAMTEITISKTGVIGLGAIAKHSL